MPIKQEKFPYEVLIPHLGKDKFALMTLDGSEFVSNTYNYRVVMATYDKSIDDEDLLRKPIVLKLRRDGIPDRIIHGLIQRTKLLGVEPELKPVYFWEATVVPSLWFLNLETECRHYLKKTAVDIVKEVLREHGVTNFEFKVQATLPIREFTVQYRETSFNFISRLLEEEGIFYWFEHTEQRHQLVFADTNSATQNSPHLHKLPYGKGTISGAEDGVIDNLEQSVSIHTGKMTFQDFNFEKSSVSLLASTSGKRMAEVYDYPGFYTTKSDGERYARLRLEEQEANLRIIHLDTISTTLLPGFRFEVTDHFDPQVNTSYIALSSSIECRQSVMDDGPGGQSSTARIGLSAIPMKVPYRPARIHPKPMIHGVQTAIVCGPAGNEIHCDKYGRVKVQFHWDRKNKRDDNSSHWIRISNTMAGANWGQISIPRIGQEVIVSFLEGDPDRPIITGRVYNDQQMPPYGLPDNKTQSGFKSRSSPGGGSADFNEFRFEDKKGSEQVYLHAQKNFDEVIEEQHTITVQKKDQITKIEQGNRTITVSVGNNSLEASAGKISEKAAQEIKMECGGSTITMTPMSIELKIGGSTISMNAGMIQMKAGVIIQNS
ncbi:MAG: type VI secretion system tip protein TssI/VgrG [Acidobacteria bacterium]|nr:type VI secretion system tip protein TssI/VgrG [Acidobacteriota bacterium]